MGNSQASTADPHFASASRTFTPKELEELRLLFDSLSSQSQSNDVFVSAGVFKEYYRIPDPLGDRMFNLIAQKRKDQKLTYEDLVIAKAKYEKGTTYEIEEFIYQIVDVDSDGSLTRSDLEALVTAIIEDLFTKEVHESTFHQSVITTVLGSARYSMDDGQGCMNSMSFQDFKDWLVLHPSIRRYLDGLLNSPDAGKSESQVPHLLHPECSSTMLVLREEYAWLIGGALSQQELDGWKLLYNSSHNGLSFSTFFGCISNNEGPTVLILKDKEGCIYGGYASQPWEKHSDFYGDMKSFLFQLHPKASIFRPTGVNNNLQWCAVNFTSESIPNGIGFGGKAHHFGLFVSASFDSGHTFSCTTFGSPTLSKSNHIYPEVIECWGVVPKADSGERKDAIKGTVLERFKEDRNMLNMVGLANSSE
ncbi:hypothetical protein V2J09_010711 [Rumex salicifolius]